MKNTGNLGADQIGLLEQHENKARESYNTFTNAREQINRASESFIGSDIMNIKDPMKLSEARFICSLALVKVL